jgi:ubiquinone/menaquinone biosynthesis C-methylase UbiE
MRDKGFHPVKSYVEAGLARGEALEIGPGPGYVGLEWLKQCPDSSLTCIEISPDMIQVAERNARTYGFENRTRYVSGDCQLMPFADRSFDCVFSNGSLHEWARPDLAFAEIVRVLKTGGSFCVTDLRRDIGICAKWMGWSNARPAVMRAGFLSSVNAAYTAEELKELLAGTKGVEFSVSEGFMHLAVAGRRC